MTEHPFHLDFNLDPPDNERLANLCGALDQHLRQIEGRLGVEISNRGNRFRVIGTPEGVRVAGDLLERIYASTEDEVLTPQQVHLFVQELGADAGPVDTNAGEQEPEFVMTKRGRIRPRGQNQNHYLGNISRHDINFGVGPAGTGKTYLAVACAVDALERDQVRRILLVRPAVEAGERLGFLPGDLAQKIDPYLRPLYDALYEMLGFEHVARLIDRNVIEIAPLAYMRGRTLNESFVILDEAQNTTI
ncbi:MAG TPA: phosphate starvation-inducible protein PhoH, partial [Chromatiales bacterium]|nr:phosphate starvation-inducible protein PhoH [Chromatiales bacterium]